MDSRDLGKKSWDLPCQDNQSVVPFPARNTEIQAHEVVNLSQSGWGFLEQQCIYATDCCYSATGPLKFMTDQGRKVQRKQMALHTTKKTWIRKVEEETYHHLRSCTRWFQSTWDGFGCFWIGLVGPEAKKSRSVSPVWIYKFLYWCILYHSQFSNHGWITRSSSLYSIYGGFLKLCVPRNHPFQ